MTLIKEPYIMDAKAAKDILIFLLIHKLEKEVVMNALEKMKFSSIRKKQRFYAYLRDNGFDVPINVRTNYKKQPK